MAHEWTGASVRWRSAIRRHQHTGRGVDHVLIGQRAVSRFDGSIEGESEVAGPDESETDLVLERRPGGLDANRVAQVQHGQGPDDRLLHDDLTRRVVLLLHRRPGCIESRRRTFELFHVFPHHRVHIRVRQLVDEVFLGEQPERRDARLVRRFQAHDRVDLVCAGVDAVAHQTREQTGHDVIPGADTGPEQVVEPVEHRPGRDEGAERVLDRRDVVVLRRHEVVESRRARERPDLIEHTRKVDALPSAIQSLGQRSQRADGCEVLVELHGERHRGVVPDAVRGHQLSKRDDGRVVGIRREPLVHRPRIGRRGDAVLRPAGEPLEHREQLDPGIDADVNPLARGPECVLSRHVAVAGWCDRTDREGDEPDDAEARHPAPAPLRSPRRGRSPSPGHATAAPSPPAPAARPLRPRRATGGTAGPRRHRRRRDSLQTTRPRSLPDRRAVSGPSTVPTR
jgi:hypothetical protein